MKPSQPLAVGAALAIATAACATLLTDAPEGTDVFDTPLPGLTPGELAVFVRGDAGFAQTFSPVTGLGPIFNNTACAACHSGDGRGRPENNLTRISLGLDPVPALGGPQIQDRATPGATPESVPPGVDISVRLPPPVFGVGLIEAIPESDILAYADPSDRNNDGISGRPNWVMPPGWVPASEPGGGPGPRLGRFSRKAQVSTLLQQTVEAYHQDMGITSDFLPAENTNRQTGGTSGADTAPDPEVPEATVRAVVDYIRMLAPPAPGEDTPDRAEGRDLFTSVGCASCHVPSYTTGNHRIAALANQIVTLYSDLLLHDMGDALADNRPDAGATGREWRTTPLWGLRVARDFLDGDLFLMHDGRAGTIDEAILLHGGEAAASRDAFVALNPAQRAALAEFVRTR